MKKYILTGLILMSFLVVLSGCGGNDVVSAPYDSTITISPASYEVTSGGGLNSIKRHSFQIAVKNVKGIPLEGVSLRIRFPWAWSNAWFPDDQRYFDLDCAGPNPSVAVVTLYDFNGTTYEAKTQPMDVKTDEDGTYEVWFDYLIGGLDANCDFTIDQDATSEDIYITYFGDFEVTSGSLYQSIKFTVNGAE